MEFHITGIVVSKVESVKDNRFSRFIVLGQVSNADGKKRSLKYLGDNFHHILSTICGVSWNKEERERET